MTLVKAPIDPSIQVILDPSFPLNEIQADIRGPVGTPYEGGTFRIRLTLGPDFPQSPPKGKVITPIFHPNVAKDTGEICVSALKKDWTPNTRLSDLLLTIKCLLIAPNPESALNEEAGRLLMEAYEDCLIILI